MDTGDPEAAKALIEMPRYQCHKQVWALKIGRLKPWTSGPYSNGDMIMQPADSRYASLILEADFIEKHKPEVGGYVVIYEDGYRSYSPEKAFESGYTRIEGT